MTDADIALAKQVSVLALVKASGLTLIRKGPNWTTKEHNSLIIFTAHGENRWWQFSRGIGGDAISWVRHTKQVSFEEAVGWLINRSPNETIRLPPSPEESPPKPLDQNLGRRFHDQMTPLDREWWLERGVPIAVQDRFLLGVCHHKQYGLCYTIPIYDNHTLVNIRMRLAKPRDPKDRYRPYDAGRGTHLWPIDAVHPDAKGLVVVAGEIKAAVMWGYDIPTVSPTAGCGHWRPDWTERLKGVRRIFVAFDPGEEEAAARITQEIGARARLVLLPDKPDDLINNKGVQAFKYHCRNAVTVKEWRTRQTVQLPDSVLDALEEGPETILPDTDSVPWKGALWP